MKRIICLLLLICLMVPAAAFAEEHEYIGRMMVVNCKREVSLRAEPTQNSERLDWVSYHTVLENCWSGYGDYCYVEYYGTAGYIHNDYLEVYDGPDAIYWGEYYEEMQIVGAPEWTPLREMASPNAKQLAEVPLGAVVTNCEYYADDYTYVNYNGTAGYVLTEYITLGSENTAEPDLSVKYVTNCEEKVSLRAEPTSSSERLAWVPKGTAIEAIGAEDGYFYVCYEGQYGYIFGDYLAYIGYTGHYVGEMVVANCESAVLYAEPAPEFGQLTMIPQGAKVDNCYAAHDGYYCVCYNDVYGYIHGNYLEFDLGTAEYIGSMQVFDCADGDDGVWLHGHANDSAEWIKKVPLGAIVENCYAYDNEFI